VIHRNNGETVKVPVTCRLDTAEEVSVYEAGGVLQRFAQDFLASKAVKSGLRQKARCASDAELLRIRLA
jgi:hypothetical protein